MRSLFIPFQKKLLPIYTDWTYLVISKHYLRIFNCYNRYQAINSIQMAAGETCLSVQDAYSIASLEEGPGAARGDTNLSDATGHTLTDGLG